MWILLLVVGALLVIHLARVQHYYWATRPIVYDIVAPPELERFLRSWGQWMEERARIVVKHLGTNAEFEFRKRRFKERPDEVVLRFRNADSTRRFFSTVQSRLDRDGVEYQLELTPKRKQPRAISVALVDADVLSPLAGVRLATIISEELSRVAPGSMQVWLDGRLRGDSDKPPVELVPATQGYQAGYDLGQKFGRGIRRVLGRP